MRPDKAPTSLFFELDDEQSANLLHWGSPNTGFEEMCDSIKFLVLACVGVMPSAFLLSDPWYSQHCQFIDGHNYNFTEGIAISLDSTLENVSAGRVFVVVIPDFKGFKGKILDVVNCH